MDCSLPGFSFLGKNTGVGCHFLLQGNLSNPEIEPALLHLLHWREDSLPVSHQGSSLGWFCIFHQIWEAGAIISSNILSDLPLSPPSGTPTMYMLVLLMVPYRSFILFYCLFTYRSFRLSSPFLILFISALQLIIDLQLDHFNQICWFCLLSAQIIYWVPLVNFSLQSLYFSDSEFLFGFFL